MNLLGYLQNAQNWLGSNQIIDLLLHHLIYTGTAVALAAVVGIPAGLLLGHSGQGRWLAGGVSHVLRAVPTVGLLFLAVLLVGSGAVNVIVVLAVLALAPVLTATVAGVRGVDREAVRTARALGLREDQIVRSVEWPLALPRIIFGLRSATVQVVATATVAGFASAGGLGRLLMSGRDQNDYPQMFAGAALITGLAVVLYVLFGLVGWLAARRYRIGRGSSRPFGV